MCDWKACTSNRLYSDTGVVRYFYVAGGVVSLCVVSMCVVSMCVVSLCVVILCVVSLCVVSLCVVSMCVNGRLVPVTGSIVTQVL